MESYPRDPTSATASYFSYENPAYNIISYTWGRYRPCDGERGEAIQITGPHRNELSWKIPEVNPHKAFSARDFQDVLVTVARNEDLKFVWVDVACIDQRDGAPDKDAEIGRQAAIFNRARQGYIWLHQTQRAHIDDSLNLMVRIRDEGVPTRSAANQHANYANNRAERSADCKTISRLLLDPWFSSLWTLQEAYIKKDAIFLSKEGHTVDFSGSPLTISALSALCTQVYPWIWQEVRSLIDSAGLNRLQAGNPLVLLSVSSRRTTTSPSDRIYGIMQVFGFKLGSSAAGHHGGKYNLRELEDQLSERLTTNMPTLSQMFLHKDQVSEGREIYHIVGTHTPDRHYSRFGATVPGLDLTMVVPREFWHASHVQTMCRFTFTPQSRVQFNGTLVSLADIVDTWIRIEGHPEEKPRIVHTDEGKTPEMNHFERSLWLDNHADVHAEGVTPVGDLNMASSSRPVAVGLSMVSKYGRDKFEVIVLGLIRDDVNVGGGDIYAGLLVRQRAGSYKRIGFCTWRQDIEGKEVENYL